MQGQIRSLKEENGIDLMEKQFKRELY
jgi:hypothetical protein